MSSSHSRSHIARTIRSCWRIEEISRFGNGHILKIAVIAPGILEHIVWCLEVVHKKERFELIPLVLQPLQANLGYGITGVHSFLLNHIFWPGIGSLYPEVRVMIFTLTRKDAVIIECGWFLLEVPFPDHGRLITGLLHLGGEKLSFWRNISVEVEHAILLRVLTGNDARTTGRTYGVVTEDTIKPHSVMGEGVDVRSWVQFRQATAVSTNSLSRMIIGHNEEDIG